MKIILLTIVFISTLLAQSTICFKENTTISTKSKSMILDGGECQGQLSAISMEKNGWNIEYSQVSKKDDTYNHLFIFKKETVQSRTVVTTKDSIENKIKLRKLAFDINSQEIRLDNVTAQNATINKGNLKIGQSGVILHRYDDKHSLIVGSAIVQSTSKSKSTLLVYKTNTLTQNAIPTSKLKPADGDTFILNHMYNSSLLIVPNYETSQEIYALYPKQNFLNPDIFAAHLKINALPLPQPKDVKEFCINNDIGTIFIVINNKLHILDTHSFKILHTSKLSTHNAKAQVPFFTKVTDIKTNFWDFGDEKINNYHNYYLALINNQTIIQNIKGENIDNSSNKKSFLNEIMDMLPW